MCLRCLDVSFALTLLALCGSWSLCWSLDAILFHCCHLTVLSLGHTNWNVQPVLQHILFSRCRSYTYHSSLNLLGNFAATHEQKKVNIIAQNANYPTPTCSIPSTSELPRDSGRKNIGRTHPDLVVCNIVQTRKLSRYGSRKCKRARVTS